MDSKYARIFKRKKSVPIITIAKKLPQIMARHEPFRARFYRIRFSTSIEHWRKKG